MRIVLPPKLTTTGRFEATQPSQWTPAQLPNLTLWLDPSDSSTVTSDGSPQLPLRVQAISDKSGYTGTVQDVVEVAKSGPPLTTINGLTAMDFRTETEKGLTRVLASGSPSTISGPDISVFMVVVKQWNSGAWPCGFQISDDPDSWNRGLHMAGFIPYGSPQVGTPAEGDTHTYRASVGRFDGFRDDAPPYIPTVLLSEAGSPQTPILSILGFTFENTDVAATNELRGYNNGVLGIGSPAVTFTQLGSPATGGRDGDSVHHVGPLFIGCGNPVLTDDYMFYGDIGEVVVTRDVMTDADIALLTTYLTNKWGPLT